MSEPTLKIRLFGTFELIDAHQMVIPINSLRLQALFAYLLLHADKPQPRQYIAFILWPDSRETHARNSLRNLLHQLRQSLPAAEHFLQADAETLCWRSTADYTLDVALFEADLEAARHQVGEQACATLEQALHLYQGDLFPGCYAEWLVPLRERLRLAYSNALEQLIQLYTVRQAYSQAFHAAERLRQHEPLQESSYAHLLRLALARGDYAHAQQVYQEATVLLQRELSVEPGPELRTLYATVTKQASTPSVLESEGVLAADPERLVGRSGEMAQIQELWRKLQPNRPQVVLLSGEPGIGKSRLAEKITHWVAQQHSPVLRAHCYADEGAMAYAPVVEWLRMPVMTKTIGQLDKIWQRELLRLLPELRNQQAQLPNLPPLSEVGQRRQLFEALAHALLALPQPLLLLLDDWQWCDWETLEWLSFLFRFATQSALFVLGTLRREEVSQNQRLHTLLLTWQRQGWLTEIPLGPLGEAEIKMLANQIVGYSLDANQARTVAHETEGNPLFVVEYMRAQPTRFAPDQALPNSTPLLASALWLPVALPSKIQAIIDYRLTQLSPLARSLADTAAVIGHRFGFALLGVTSGQSEEEVIQGLDELSQRRIVQEVAAGVYDFSHDKLREVAYAQLSATRRQWLHRKIGQELTQLPSADPTAISTQAAFHFEQANVLHQAIRYYMQAATDAADLHAYHRAAQLYDRAITVADKLNLPAETLLQLYTERGRMLEHAGEFAAAIAVYQQLAALARRRADKVMEATAVAELATAYSGPTSTHDLVQAQTMFARGLVLARELGDYDLEARLLWSQMVTASHYGEDTDAQTAGAASLALCRQHQLEKRLPYVLNDLAINLRLSGRQAEGQRHAEEARTLFHGQGERPMLADNLAQQAWSDYHQVRFADALHWAQESAILSRKIENGWNLALAIATRGLVNYQLGAWGDALVDFEESIRIGKAAGFVIAATLIPSALGALLRRLGSVDQAQALHAEAYQAACQQAPFTRRALAAQLAQDAFALGQTGQGMQWLQTALMHQSQGAISRAWMTLADLPLAAVVAAQTTDDWTQAQLLVAQALVEAQQRDLPIYWPYLQIAQALCDQAQGLFTSATTHLQTAITLAQPARLTPLLWQAHHTLTLLYHQQQRPVDAQVQQQQAIAQVRALAAALPDNHLRHRFLTTPDVQATLTTL